MEQALKYHLLRQLEHWTQAGLRLMDFSAQASSPAWQSIEEYLSITIRTTLGNAVKQLLQQADSIKLQIGGCSTIEELKSLHSRIIDFRQRYLRVETVLDFYTDAVNSRTNRDIASMLQACDILASRSMRLLLDQLKISSPPVLTYIDKGLGASILRAGLRLWDGSTLSPVAAIKIVRHNLVRPTSLIHEAGHQVAGITGWNEELSILIHTEVKNIIDSEIADLWSEWASEIAADSFAFAHTGYASVLALHDVLDGNDSTVFKFILGDPHPVGFVRVLLGTEMCRSYYGSGPWDKLETIWKTHYPLHRAPAHIRILLEKSMILLPKLIDLVFNKPLNSFRGKSLAKLVNPINVSPKALKELQNTAGRALFDSHHWIWQECLRLLALSGYDTSNETPFISKYEWMKRLGTILDYKNQ